MQLVRIQNRVFRTVVMFFLAVIVFVLSGINLTTTIPIDADKKEPIINDTVIIRRTESPADIRLFEVTAYSPTVAETDGNPHVTASMKHVYEGGIAADLSVLPFGSMVIIPNYNDGKPCIVIDTGSMIKGNKIDVFFWDTEVAKHWGRRKNVPVEVILVNK
jgi:3D (Asp-Asp-Asp) domain-containing protein